MVDRGIYDQLLGQGSPLGGMGILDAYQSNPFIQSGIAQHQSAVRHIASSVGSMCTAVASSIGEEQQITRKTFNETKPQKEKSLFTEMAKDIKGCLLEYRGVLYFLLAALIVDELIFKGAFRHRLQGLADKVVAKVEEKVS